eukprot:1797459-Rhodomonas_salina.2
MSPVLVLSSAKNPIAFHGKEGSSPKAARITESMSASGSSQIVSHTSEAKAVADAAVSGKGARPEFWHQRKPS